MEKISVFSLWKLSGEEELDKKQNYKNQFALRRDWEDQNVSEKGRKPNWVERQKYPSHLCIDNMLLGVFKENKRCIQC